MAAATRGEHSVIGPFVATLHQTLASPGWNYAIPVDRAEPTRRDIEDLVEHFRAHDRKPRLELIERAAPAVPAALAAAGFREDDRLPQLYAGPDTSLTPRRPGDVEPALLTEPEDAELLALATLQNRAYGETEAAGPGDVDRLRRCLARGVLIATARIAATGELVGAGLIDVTGPDDPVGELAAVATAEERRGRGIAGAVSAYLAEAAFARGMTLVFLECEAKNRGVYRKTGFIDCGERLWMSRDRHAAPEQ